MTCSEVQPQAAGLALLEASDPLRLAAFDHARACASCLRALRDGERLGSLLDALPAPAPPSPAVLQATLRSVENLQPLATAARDGASDLRRDLGMGVATALGALAAVVLARHRVPLSQAWLAAIALGLGAACLAARSHSWSLGAAAGIALSLLGTLWASADGGLDAAIGTHCLLTELGTATLPMAALLALPGSRAQASHSRHIASLAATGALAGQAALLLTCHAHGPSHLAVFHSGTVALAALLGYLLWSLRRSPRAA
jgi:hypothetical protein